MKTNRRAFLGALCCLPVVARPEGRHAAFERVLARAEHGLRQFRISGERVHVQLERMAKAFCGADLASRADVAVRSVRAIGGTWAFTEVEQARVARYIAKYDPQR